MLRGIVLTLIINTTHTHLYTYASHSLTNKWIVVHEVEQFSRPKRKASKNLSGLNDFTRVSNDTKLDEVDDSITEHLRVNAEVTVI